MIDNERINSVVISLHRCASELIVELGENNTDVKDIIAIADRLASIYSSYNTYYV